MWCKRQHFFLLPLFVTLAAVSIHGNYYEEDEPCSESPSNPALVCRRWTSCVECRYYVRNCYCDMDCGLYGDCCSDATSRKVQQFYDNQTSCVSTSANRLRVNVLVIDACPFNFNGPQAIADHCVSSRDEKGLGLLIRGNKSGLLYANEFCALCHGEDDSSYDPMHLLCYNASEEPARAVDSPTVILHQLVTTGYYKDWNNVSCELNYGMLDNRSKVTYRECEPGIVHTCAANATEDERDQCINGPVSFVFGLTEAGDKTQNPPYKNEWCAKCNHIQRYECKPPEKIAGGFIKGLSSLVDLTSLSCARNNKDKSADAAYECDNGKFSCPAGETYKPFKGCKPSLNNQGQSNMTDSCHEWEEIANGSVIASSAAKGDYKLENGKMYVCVRSTPQKENTRPNPDSLLTKILLVISLVSLLVELSLYFLFKALRNIPGLILICLSVSLFVAELLFLISIFLEANETFLESDACTVLAVILHYAFLASIFWVNVMAFDVGRMLAAPMNSQSKSRFIWYSIYAWGCPLVFVVSAVIAELQDASIIPAYAEAHCWISTRYGLIVFFLGPVFLLLALNVILYIISIVSIVRDARQVKLVHPNLKERFYLALKLIIVMGLPWIVSVFAAFIDSIVLDYMFAVTVSLQGTLTAVCFVFSKTVIGLLKKNNRLSTFTKSSRMSSTSANLRSSRISGGSNYGRQRVKRSSSIEYKQQMSNGQQ